MATIANTIAAAQLCFASLNVLGQVYIFTQPSDQWVDRGATVTNSVSTFGATTYQWQFNNTALSGATNPVLVLSDFQADMVGNYSVIVSSPAARVTSRSFRMEINSPRPHTFESVLRADDGSVSLSLDGNPTGLVHRYFDLYPVESTQDFNQWVPFVTLLRTNALPEALTIIDRDAIGVSRRFYRMSTNHFPTPFPKPTGPYAVGSFSRLITDPLGANRYNVATNGSFMITVWYPAQPKAGDLPAALFAPPLAAEATVWSSYGFGPLEKVMPLLVGHSLLNANMASDPVSYPVVIVSPGFTDVRGDHTAKMELFASHGFVGVSIDHGHANATVFPDGRMLRSGANPSQLGRYFPQDLRDVQFVLEELTRMNQDDPILKSRLDLDHVATIGHSFGGGVAGEIARTDPRVRVSVHLDAYYQAATALLQNGLGKPLFYAGSTEAGGMLDLFNRATRDAYWMRMANTRHADLADNGPWVDRADDAARRSAIALNTCLLSFLNKYLKNEDDHLLDQPSARFPEVQGFQKK